MPALQATEPATPGVSSLRRGGGAAHRALEVLWGAPLVGIAVTAVLSAGYGLLAGWLTPRGPLTTAEALTAMAAAAAVGVGSGFAMRSRWAALVSPVLFTLQFELMRLSVQGPTVDAINLGSLYGIVAFVTGRGLHAVLVLPAMVLGALIGAALARRASARMNPHGARLPGRVSAGTVARRSITAVSALLVLLLASFVAQPAGTDPISAADGRPLEGAIAEFAMVDTGHHELSVMLRGHSDENPVLLFLAGGPGGTELGAMRNHGGALEEDFVVATLDQRGTGTSMSQFEPSATLTLEGAIRDVGAVTDYLRDRFGQDRIYLAGQSWGTLLGVLAAEREPERYVAFVGVGQMVSPPATDTIFYEDTLDWARSTGRDDLARQLQSNGAPPYDDIRKYEAALAHEQEMYPYDHTVNAEGAGQNAEGILVEEYSAVERIRNLGATLDVFATLYPQAQDTDLREEATRLEIPVFLAQGRHEAPGRAGPAEEWFERLEAPHKELRVFETSGHRPLWEQPDEFHEFMRHVLDETAP